MRKSLLIAAIGVGALAASIGCQSGDTDGGKASDDTFTDGVFVADDSNTGSITIISETDEIPVGETQGFFVQARRSDGAVLANIQISCDSERGLAILEPLRGFELTDESGHLSGTVGCAVPGSLQLACRSSIGGNDRDFFEFKCRGDVPPGFSGFPGAAGGGLGGGVLASEDGGGIVGSNGSNVRITAIDFSDEGGGTPTTSIDTRQTANCNAATTGAAVAPEPFFDTSVTLKVVNNTNQTVRFTRLTYTVREGSSSGRTISSDDLQLNGAIELAGSGGEANLNALVFKALGGQKYFFDGNVIPSELGFRRVDFKLFGSTDLNESTVAEGGAVVSFGTFDRCS